MEKKYKSSRHMKPPYYIVINDKDKNHIIRFFERDLGGRYYESEVKSQPKGARRMRHIDTALDFRWLILSRHDEFEPEYTKVVRVNNTQKEVIDAAEQGRLKVSVLPSIFEVY